MNWLVKSVTAASGNELHHIMGGYKEHHGWPSLTMEWGKELLETNPELAKGSDRSHCRTPLHWGMHKGAPIELIEAVLQAYPDAIKTKDGNGRVPFHLGMAHTNASLDVLKAVRDMDPKAAAKAMGMTPLHLKMMYGESVAEAKKANLKRAAASVDKLSRTCLHYGMMFGAPLENVKHVLKAFPEGAERKDERGQTPLHLGARYECDNGTSGESVKAVLEMNPSVAKIKNAEGKLPLHYALEYGASPEAVAAIVRAYPEACKAQDHYGNTPLHYGLSFKTHHGVFEYSWRAILAVDPSVAEITNLQGQTPLHKAVEYGTSAESVNKIVRMYPKAIEVQDQHGKTPLHYAFASSSDKRRSDEVSNLAMVKTNPLAANIADHFGNTPLHLAVKHRASFQSIRALLNACPEAAGMKDKPHGMTPLHHVFRSKRGDDDAIDIINAVMQLYPLAAKRRDSSGKTPVHLAVQNCSLEGLQVVLCACPDAAGVQDSDGHKTPLHYVFEFSFDEAMVIKLISTILNSFPLAAQIPDKHGDTPVHLAVKCGMSPTCFETILRFCPEAACVKNVNNGMTTLHCVFQYTPNEDFLDLMNVFLAANPSAAKVMKKDGKTPLHLAVMHEFSVECCKAIVEACPETARMKDKNGMTPLKIGLEKAVPPSTLTHLLDGVRLRDDQGSTPLLNLVLRQKDVNGEPDTKAFRMLVEEYPEAAEIENNSGQSPFGILISRCTRASTFDTLVRDGTILRLRLLLNGVRNGRQLKNLCKVDNPIALSAFFSIFGDFEEDDKANAVNMIDLNCEYIPKWTVLEILADLDNEDASNVLLQIVMSQEDQLDKEKESNPIMRYKIETSSSGRAHIFVVFNSLRAVTAETMRKVADRAKVSNSSDDMSKKMRKWAEKYGRFLGEYLIEKDEDPKHRSASCVVMLATELREKVGRKEEVKVALKFFGNDEDFCREIMMREAIVEKSGMRLNDYVAMIKSAYSSNKALTEELKNTRNSSDEKSIPDACGCHVFFREDFEKELLKYGQTIYLNPGGEQSNSLKLRHLLVMECGSGMDLSDIISHQDIAGKNLPMVIYTATKIAECLRFLNEKCAVLHGDAKPRNFIYQGVGGGYKAIDLDNAALINIEKAGPKQTSSGYLPPERAAAELFYRLRESWGSISNALNAFEDELDVLEKRVRKAFETGNLDDLESLSFAQRIAKKRLEQLRNVSDAEAVTASKPYDMWGFGLLLYFLCTGKQLFVMDTREEVNNEELQKIQEWDEASKEAALSEVPYGWPKGVIADLLQRNPERRPSSWNYVIRKLQHLNSESSNRRWEPITCPSMWSISYGQLMKIDEEASDKFGAGYAAMTMRDIVEKIVKPICREKRTSYALSLNPDGLMIDAFITHSWDEPFQLFVTSIRKVFQTTVKKPNLWICAFALSQGEHGMIKQQVGPKDSPLTNSPFIIALQQASAFVVVRNSTTDLYSRIWCVCELFYAVKLGYYPDKTFVTGPNSFSHLQTSCIDAKSSNPDDRERIMNVLCNEHDVMEIDNAVHLFRTQKTPE